MEEKKSVGRPSKPKSCLRNEKVIVKFLPKKGAFDVDPNSPLAGGMADTAVRSYVVPMRKDGSRLVNPLSNEEKAYLEIALGLEEDALNIYKRPCYWMSGSKNAINRVTLNKDGMTLDLSDPEDYVKYAILRSNSERICPSWKDYEEHAKPTYEFCLVSENAEVASVGVKTSNKSKCFKLYFKYEDDANTLRTILRIIENRKVSPSTPIENLQDKIQQYIENSPTKTLAALEDEYLAEKTIIDVAVDKGVVASLRGEYILKDGNVRLCEDYDTTASYQNASKFLASAEHQEIKFKIEELIK